MNFAPYYIEYSNVKGFKLFRNFLDFRRASIEMKSRSPDPYKIRNLASRGIVSQEFPSLCDYNDTFAMESDSAVLCPLCGV